MANKRTTQAAKPAKRSTVSVKNAARKKPIKRTVGKAVPAKTLQKEQPTPVSQARTSDRKAPALRFKKSYVILGLAALLLISLLYAARGLFVAATVNGKPISRIAVVQELERQSGKQTLDSVITKTLVQQEAEKKNITITDKQIDEEIKKIEDNLKQQGQELDQVLSLQGMTRESLREDVEIRKTIELLLGDKAKVSEKEVDDYIASNSANFPAETDPKQLKDSVTQQLQQQKLSEELQTWLAQIRQNAKINYIVNY
jgi:parvulin-like peptidyl-prolyl isomerase